ncbi:DUF6779 domain-containing protein [Mycobacterium sp. DL440]|uniref:DUF6779 domain-containing protein n=1 Tax=Mycobacterium sp. DL440 TaxID=2675523 RepID=UPI00141DBCDD|nr:DUF6779 domain-containing protein [Mycobacterium sp. DL440]
MTVLPRGGRPRRGGRRPGWLLLTVLLVLAILASSALVFTDRVELLKLAVILALWAAVVAAFVSVIYRRQSDLDQAKARDLKFVYDLQLDREISARREYELTVETQLRRELASELRAQAADEVAALRSELAALRANLEILFDTDLVHRPAIETDKSAVRTAGRVTASRLDVPPVEVTDIRMSRTQESPIIDVPAEPHPPENDWVTSGGVHRLPSRPVPAGEQPRRRRRPEPPRQQETPRQPEPKASPRPGPQPAARPESQPQPRPEPQPVFGPEPQPVSGPRPEPQPQPRPEPPPAARRQPEPPSTWAPPPPPPAMPPMQPSPTIEAPEPEPPSTSAPAAEPAATGWEPAPAEGQWIPAGVPGSNWATPVAQNGAANEYVGRRRAQESTPTAAPAPKPEPAPAAEPALEPAPTPAPAMSPGQAPEPPRGRHSAAGEVSDAGLPAPAQPSPALATESSQPPEPPRRASRHRTDDEPEPPNGHHADGQSVNELLARFQTGPAEGGRRRRRKE